MRVSRVLPVLVAGAVFTATAAPASAATPGVGTTAGSLEVLSLDVGELVDLGLLSDFATANTDEDVNDPGAAAALKALVLDTVALPDPVELGVLDVESDGEEKTASNEAADLPGEVGTVLTGSLLPASLLAALTDPGAVSTTAAGITNLDILGGIAGIDATQLGISANSLTEQADGSRRLVIDNLTVLELGDLLAGLGIPLELLPLDVVLGLISELGLTDQLLAQLEGLDLPVDLGDLLVGGTLSLDGLTELIGGLDQVDAGDLCDGLGLPLLADDLCEVIEPVTDVVDELITPVLDEVLGLLGDTALLELNALDVSIITKATDSLETSVAEITATLGGISVAGLVIPEVDVAQAIAEAKAQLDDVLTLIGGNLLDDLGLLDIGLLEQDAGVAEDGDAITSTASFTGLRVELEGLTDDLLGDVLGDLGVVGESLPEDSVGALLGGIPANPITDLLDVDGVDAVSALSDGLSLKVASLGQSSTFTEVLNASTPAAPAAPELPKTGSNDALMLALAAIAAGGALGIRRVVRTKD